MLFSRFRWMVSAVAFMAGCGATMAEQDMEVWRLFVADHTKPVVHALDVESGKVLKSFDIASHASLVASDSGRIVLAVQREGDVVHAIASGITLEQHGDHRDLEVSDPKLVDVEINGKTPGHVVAHGAQIAVFYDGEDVFHLFEESELLRGKVIPQILSSIAAHHGVAVPLHEYILVSVPDLQAEKKKPDDLPPRFGLRVIDIQGNETVGSTVCSDLHGEAFSGRTVAFGCSEGVLLAVYNGKDVPTLKMLNYGADFPESRVSTLLGAKAIRFFLGNYGADKIALIEPDSETPIHLLDLPTRWVDFALDPAKPQNAYILTEDGNLHLVDVLKRQIVLTRKITDTYSQDGHWRDPRPRLAVAGQLVAVTDPLNGLVRLITSDDLQEHSTIAVEGKPFAIVAVGGSGLHH